MNPHKKPILGPDKVSTNVRYTFTVAPNDDYQFWNDNENGRIKKATNHMTYIVKRHPNINFVLNMDVSSTGRIHWHGTIMFKHDANIRYFYMEVIHDLLKNHQIEMDTIADIVVWDEYCHKVRKLWDITVSSSDKLHPKVAHPILHKPIDEY